MEISVGGILCISRVKCLSLSHYATHLCYNINGANHTNHG